MDWDGWTLRFIAKLLFPRNNQLHSSSDARCPYLKKVWLQVDAVGQLECSAETPECRALLMG
jgi:hypothetical protein